MAFAAAVLLALALLLTLAGPALADGISVQYTRWADSGNWPMYDYGTGSYWWTMWGYLQDQDPNTSGTQIQVVTTKSVNMLEFWYQDPRLGGTLHLGAQWYLSTPTQASPYPQFLNLSDGCHVYVESPNTDPATAAPIGATGRWKFWYTDNTTGWADTLTTTVRPNNGASVGDPIDAGSGTVSQSLTDLVVPGKGLNLTFAHAYSSARNQQDGPLGYGWYDSYSSSLAFLSSNVVCVDYPDGGYVQFTATTGGNYSAPVGIFETLTKLGNNTYTLAYKDGTTFYYSSTGVLTSIQDRYGNTTTLSYTSNLLTTVSDSSGRSLAFTYTSNRITQVEAKAGGTTYQTISFTYDGSGNLATSVDPNGHTTAYAYDSAHHLLSVRQPEAVADPNKNPLFTNTYTDGRVTAQLDALGRSSSVSYNPSQQVTTFTDPLQHEIQYGWNASYNTTGSTNALNGTGTVTYAANGLPASVTDPNGHTSTVGYDAQANVTAIYGPAGIVSRALYDTRNNPVWTEDALGERLSRTSSGLLLRDDFSSNSLSSYTTATETGNPDPTWSIGSGLLSQTTRYNFPSGSLARNSITGATCATAYLSPYFASEAGADVLVATQAREGGGQAFPGYSARVDTSSISLEKRASGAWTSLASQAYTTAYGDYRQVRVYVQNGTVYLKAGATDLSQASLSASDATYTSGSGGVRAYSQCKYDYLELRSGATINVTGVPSGYLVRATKGSQTVDATSSGGTTTVDTSAMLFPLDSMAVYDSSGLKVAELTTLDLADMGGGDTFAYDGSVGHRTTYTWDANGTFLTAITTPVGTTSFDWNSDGSLDSLTDARSHTWSYGYNSAGDLTSATDPTSHATSYEYDALGRMTAQEDANSSRVEFTYDDKGNATTVKDPLAQTDSQHRHQLDMTYDANDNVTAIEDGNGNTTSFGYDDMNHLNLVTDALSGQTIFTYDNAYNRASREDANGHTTHFAYDNLDRLHTVTDPLSKVTTYGYDSVGNLTSLAYPGGDTTNLSYTSDDLLHVISHSGNSTTYTYSYNTVRQVSQVEKNGGKVWGFTYDGANRLSTETDHNNSSLGTFTVTPGYDANSNVTSLGLDGLVSLALTYDARDELSTLTDPGGTTDFSHDAGGRLTEIATPDGSTSSITYDAASRPTEVENVTDSGTQDLTYTYDANNNILSEGSTTYTYDALNRLSSWYDPARDVTTTYTYDAGGNVTEVKEDGTTTKSFTCNAGDEITNTGYTYDDSGNLTADGTYSYTYDADNQLVEVDQGLTSVATMAYDFIGRRTSLTTSAGTTYFHYAGDLLVAESNGSGDVTATYAYAPEGGLISMTRGGSTYYYQTNAQGDVVSLTDSTGAIVDSYGYDPWGKPLSSTGSVTNPFRYAGCYYDGSTGLYYLYHRYYDPATMRFLTLDPASIVTFDRYGYAKDNPVNGADPDGLGLGSTLRAGLDYANVHFNPAYMAINGYYNEVQACEKGCSLSTCLKYGMQGVIGVASTAMLVLPVGEMVGGAIEEALAEGAAEVAPEVAEGSAGVASSRGGVYSLRDAEGNVVRTGRTNNLAARAAAHAKNAVLKQFKFNIEFETDDYATQRGLENVLYNAHPEAQAANGGYNMIRAISPSNPNLGKYLQAAADYLSGLMGQ